MTVEQECEVAVPGTVRLNRISPDQAAQIMHLLSEDETLREVLVEITSEAGDFVEALSRLRKAGDRLTDEQRESVKAAVSVVLDRPVDPIQESAERTQVERQVQPDPPAERRELFLNQPEDLTDDRRLDLGQMREDAKRETPGAEW